MLVGGEEENPGAPTGILGQEAWGGGAGPWSEEHPEYSLRSQDGGGLALRTEDAGELGTSEQEGTGPPTPGRSLKILGSEAPGRGRGGGAAFPVSLKPRSGYTLGQSCRLRLYALSSSLREAWELGDTLPPGG